MNIRAGAGRADKLNGSIKRVTDGRDVGHADVCYLILEIGMPEK